MRILPLVLRPFGVGPSSGCFYSLMAQIQPWQYFELLTTFHHLFLRLSPKSVLLCAFSDLPCSTEVFAVDSPTLQAMVTHLTFFHFVFAPWPEHFCAERGIGEAR